MKYPLVLMFALLTSAAMAQVVEDSVMTGLANKSQIWYSFADGEVKTADLDAWHIAFENEGNTSSLRVNGATGNMIYAYPNGDTSDWANIDTAGMYENWTPLYNTDTAWHHGALNQNIRVKNEFDLGWGVYDMTNHNVVGDSFFIMKLVSGDFKKLLIERLAGGTYHFMYANLDGSDEQDAEMDKEDFKTKNFGYYNMIDHKMVDFEPNKGQWDIVFTKYISMVPTGPNTFSPYAVAGVLLNKGYSAKKITEVDIETYEYDGEVDESFSSYMNTIGSDWKSYDRDAAKYVIAERQVYIIGTADGRSYQVAMTGYGGSTTGQFNFSIKELALGLENPTNKSTTFTLFPNPSNGNEVKLNSSENKATTAILYSVTGQQVWTAQLDAQQQKTINVSRFKSGIYFLSLQSRDGMTSTKKLIIR